MTCGSLCPTDGEGGGTDEPEALPALMVWCFSALPVVHSSETLHLTACVFFFIWTTLSLENWHINYALLKTKSQWSEEGHSFSEAAELHQTFPDQRGRSVGPEETHGLHGVQHESQVIVQLVSAGYHMLSVTSPLYWKTILNILM